MDEFPLPCYGVLVVVLLILMSLVFAKVTPHNPMRSKRPTRGVKPKYRERIHPPVDMRAASLWFPKKK